MIEMLTMTAAMLMTKVRRVTRGARSANRAMIPTMMKPITGVMRSRAKAGMTMPAAPRIVSASLSAVPPPLIPAAIGALEQAPARLSRAQPTNEGFQNRVCAATMTSWRRGRYLQAMVERPG